VIGRTIFRPASRPPPSAVRSRPLRAARDARPAPAAAPPPAGGRRPPAPGGSDGRESPPSGDRGPRRCGRAEGGAAAPDACGASAARAGGATTLTWDANGSLTTLKGASGTTTFTWNARNQLTAIGGGGVTASFVYDGLGRREKKTVNGALTEFLFDGLNPVQETAGTPIVANLLTGPGVDEYFLRADAAGTRAFLTDALGSTVALTDATGALQTTYTYEPFGATTAAGPASSSSFQYTGRENDGTGLYYYRARYYHPGLARFLREDHLSEIGVSRYAYARNTRSMRLIQMDSAP
jgi:RHS repeat-associated protein